MDDSQDGYAGAHSIDDPIVNHTDLANSVIVQFGNDRAALGKSFQRAYLVARRAISSSALRPLHDSQRRHYPLPQAHAQSSGERTSDTGYLPAWHCLEVGQVSGARLRLAVLIRFFSLLNSES
jgi:hypothetical protein